jgi:hypothetical protein
MSDIFISHSSKDKDLACKIQEQLKAKGATAFVASTSIAAGEKWSPEIRTKLTESEWVLFLATPDSCVSPAVNQELGGSWLAGKRIIPLLSGVHPEQLPAWTKDYQALGLAEEPEKVDGLFTRIAEFLHKKKFFQWAIGGLVIGIVVWFVLKVIKPSWLFWGLLLAGIVWLAARPLRKTGFAASA